MKTREYFGIYFSADVDVEQTDILHTDVLSRSEELPKLLEKLGFEDVDIWKIEWK